ncbi:membrane dipeptidase [Acetobacteraceae bacterium H6797]|nr:membrane dipeptidase [Acetobacteraceae bacterium H6797]
MTAITPVQISPEAAALHGKALVVDALNICNWSRDIFEGWRAGGFTTVSCTCALWENFRDTIANIVQWNRWFEEHADLIMPVRTVADIATAKATNRTGVILSWQNSSSIEDQLGYIGIFKQLGVGIVQLTYNTQNYSGAGYLEPNDSGLTGFGREVVSEMNKVGILVDLSHVGDKTAADTIAYSAQPVAYTHILPRALKNVPRNKPDELIKAVAEKGGMVGLSMFSPGLPAGNDATVEDYLDAMEHMIKLVGEDHVGIGTDYSQDHPRPGPFLQWCNMDKGYARELTKFGSVKIEKPKGVAKLHELPNLTAAMLRRGWSEETILKLLGANWVKLLGQVWSPSK